LLNFFFRPFLFPASRSNAFPASPLAVALFDLVPLGIFPLDRLLTTCGPPGTFFFLVLGSFFAAVSQPLVPFADCPLTDPLLSCDHAAFRLPDEPLPSSFSLFVRWDDCGARSCYLTLTFCRDVRALFLTTQLSRGFRFKLFFTEDLPPGPHVWVAHLSEPCADGFFRVYRFIDFFFFLESCSSRNLGFPEF